MRKIAYQTKKGEYSITIHFKTRKCYITTREKEKTDETEEGIQIEKWCFGEKLHTWYGEKVDDDQIPLAKELSSVYLSDGIGFLTVKGNLLCIKRGEEEIRVIASDISSHEEIVSVNW